MGEHTPGPWTSVVVDENDHFTWCIVAEGGALVVGEHMREDPDHRSFTDALLIAAAPDLLEACKAALHNRGGRSVLARNAIAKAEGRGE